jgi:hypothetical protein
MQAMCQLQGRHDRFETGRYARAKVTPTPGSTSNFWKATQIAACGNALRGCGFFIRRFRG